MAELAQPSSLLLSGAETDFSRPGSYGSVSQDHVIRFSDHKSSSEKAPDEAEAEEKEFPWIQTTLISSAMVGIVVVMVVFAHDTSPWQDFFNRGAGHVLVDLCAAFLFFASSDVFAQILPAMYAGQGFGRTNDLHATILKQLSVVRYPRAARCGALGILINGLGYWAWVHALNKVIPQREVDDNGNTLQAFGLLISKSLLDSCLWGTTANSMGIIGRRLLEGDSLWHALDVWAVNILGVTAWELRFWPFWSATQFCLVPNSLQVIFASLGSLSWNFYISFTALQEPVAHAKVRIGIKVDGVSSPLHRSPARRSVGASQMRSSPLREALRSPMILPADLDLADELVDAAESMAYGRRYKMQQSATGHSAAPEAS